jgi:tripartite-type tricarboxylate transporter receptor subunit TctC
MRFETLLPFAALVVAAGTAQAQSQYPAKPITYVLATTAGGGAETAFRPIAESLAKVLGQSVVLEFKPGAGGDIASLYVKSQPPDGYTVFAASNQVVVRSVVPDAKIDARKDFTHISPSGGQPFLIAVNAEQIKATTIRELLEDARKRPGDINYATYGVGSGAHLLMELLLHEAKVKMTVVHYKSTAGSVTDTVGGRTQVVIGIMPTMAPFVASQGGSGKLRVLAVSSQERTPIFPDIPAMKESGYQLDYMGWSGFMGPPGMSPELISRLNRAYNDAIKDPETVARTRKNGSINTGGTPQQLTQLVEREYNSYMRLIKETGLKLE